MKKISKYTVLVIFIGALSCSTKNSKDQDIELVNIDNSLKTIENLDKYKQFSNSGTIILSYPISKLINDKNQELSLNSDISNIENISNKSEKTSTNINTDLVDNGKFAPLLGFIPLHSSFQPADNEVWLELDREKSKVNLYRGKEKIKELSAQGKINLTPGQYPLQHKQKSPLWYAPDEYFEKRQLRTPPRGDHFRYRRGALGQYALYPTMDFIIHCGPFMSDEVGGLRLEPNDLLEVFNTLSIGSSIVVK